MFWQKIGFLNDGVETVANSSYTDEEIQEILQVLFQEKKKCKDQEESLRKNSSEINRLRLELIQARQQSPKTVLTDSSKPSEDIDKLKNSLNSYQQKYEDAQKALTLQTDHLSEAKKEISSLNDQISKLKEMVKQSRVPKENPQLEEANRLLQETKEQSLRHKQRAEKLASLVVEREKKISELQQFEYGFRKSNEQKQEITASIEKQKELLESVKKEKAGLQKELEEARQRSMQLERVIQFLRERQEEARLENNQFQEEFQILRQTVATLSDQIKETREENEKLELVIQQEKMAKQDAIEEVTALQSQFETLKNTIVQKNKEIELQESHIRESEKIFKTLNAEKESLTLILKEKSERFEAIVNELETIKQTLTQSFNESKEIEKSVLEMIKEKRENAQKMIHLEEQILSQKEDIQLLREQLGAATEREKVTNLQLEILKEIEEHKQKLQTEHDRLKEAFDEISSRFEETMKAKEELAGQLLHHQEQFDFQVQGLEELNRRLEALTAEKDGIKENLAQMQSSQEDAESRFKVAQQHLAKKVKENADLTQKLQEKEAHLQEIQIALNQSRMKNGEIQSSLDLQLLQEKRLQEQLQESIRSAEALASRWEGKYFAISEKWQESESKVRELSKLEEKYNQLQSLLANLGTVLGTPLNYNQPSPIVRESSPIQTQSYREHVPQKPIEELQKEDLSFPEKEKPYQNLFDMPKTQQRPKSSLFE